MNKKEELRNNLEALKNVGINTIDDIIKLVEILPEDSAVFRKNCQIAKIVENEDEIREYVENFLHRLRAPKYAPGYDYLVDAIVMGVKNTEVLKQMKKNVYIPVAEKYKNTPSAISTSIDREISLIYSFGEVERLNNILHCNIGLNKFKPTNGEFIKKAVKHIIQNICLTYREKYDISEIFYGEQIKLQALANIGLDVDEYIVTLFSENVD